MRQRYLIFTDLDGTLLDHATYDHRPASAALSALARRHIPVIPTTSKTTAEMRVWRERLGLPGPFIIENGSALCVPAAAGWPVDRTTGALAGPDGWHTYVFGTTLEVIHARLAETDAAHRFNYVSFSAMSITDVVGATGLDPDSAALARTRDYSEPLLWRDTDPALVKFAGEMTEAGLTVTRGGRFVHVLGPTNKGLALERTTALYASGDATPVCTIALGDSPNDAEMLNAADIAVIVNNPHVAPLILEREQVLRTHAFGPAGWQEAIDHLLRTKIG